MNSTQIGEGCVLFSNDLQQEFIVLFKRQVEDTMFNL